MATLQEWLADPDGAAAVRAAVGVDEDGHPRGILGDAELLRVIGNFPLATLAAFPGLGIDHDLVRALTGEG
jgi:beta-glucosidase